MCDDCIQRRTDDEIKEYGESYGVKNINKIIKRVKKLRKTHFTKEKRLIGLNAVKEQCLKNIEELNEEIEAINKEISLLE